jgi:hypothetical protein
MAESARSKAYRLKQAKAFGRALQPAMDEAAAEAFGFPKPSRTARIKAEAKADRELKHDEDKAKAAVRRRDRVCRFPLCGCRKLGLVLKAFAEVSHAKHKGMGGNPSGDRSITGLMVLLCRHRHQDGAVSRHAGTLRAVYLTAAGFDGPVAWRVEQGAFFKLWQFPPDVLTTEDDGRLWVEVAREVRPGKLETLLEWQAATLAHLAEMEA